MVLTGSDTSFCYDTSESDYGNLPQGWSYKETAGVCVDEKDRVYVFSRSEHPIIVLDNTGKIINHWGERIFTLPHGIALGPDDSIYCIDAGDHTVRKFDRQGKLLMTLGEPGKSSGRLSGEPFNGPTHVGVNQQTGEFFVSDGYSNARVHKYTPDGDRVLSWGQSGTDPGEFNTVHNIAIDSNGRVYVADRENHRVQVFSSTGEFQTQWVNMAMASCIWIDQSDNGLVYVGEFYAGIPQNEGGMGNWTGNRLGPRITILDQNGEVVSRLGDQPIGESAGQFVAPHGIAVNSIGDIFLAEVSWSAYGIRQDPPREIRSLQKLTRRS